MAIELGPGRRPLLRRVARALIAYGVVGIVLAIAALAALGWSATRLGAFGDGIDARVVDLSDAVDDSAQALRDAADSADSFTASLDQTEPAVRKAASAIRQIRPRLVALRDQADSINILGSRPLSSLGGLFGEMSTELEGLDSQLDDVGDSLVTDQDALRRNADSLAALATTLERMSADLAQADVGGAISTMRTVVFMGLLLFILWTAVPGVGAVALGLWMRRELAPFEDVERGRATA
ncbi:MAG: hypothetical protein ACJ761_02660 [Chloroflexota bacterium]